jgi:signal transduction histidine kinase/CheY-like chemotaxis protein
MSKAPSGFEYDLRLAPKPVLVAAVVLGQLLFLGAEILRSSYAIMPRISHLFLLTCALSAMGWLLVDWKPTAGRWFTVVALIAEIHLAHTWLGLPCWPSLVSIPIALAVPLISLPGATAIALAESLFLFVFLRCSVPGLDPPAVTNTLLAIWAILGVMHAVYRRVFRVTDWLQEYFERAQARLEQAEDRKVELSQTMESLKHANRQLALANERTAGLRAIAEESQRTKAAFVANVSHEFRTPLNMIIGLVDLMVETPEIYDVIPSPKMREDLKVIHRNCKHLSSMVDDVLDLTQMETGRMTLHRERVDLEEIMDKSVTAVRPLLEEKELALQVVVRDGLPKVYCDRTRIRQVILNLLSNAARFTEQGGIRVEAAREGEFVRVEVADTGPGIRREDAENIFQPFWQGVSQLWRQEGGSGLGLSISRRFVKLHGGRMWLQSEQGMGSSFFFTLPISPPMQRRVKAQHKIMEDWVWHEQAFRTDRAVSVEDLVRPRVVICDSTRTLHPRFARHSDDIEFVHASDLARAKRELEECPAHAVVINEYPPDRLQPLLETLKREAPGTPVIGCSVPEPTRRAIDAGAVRYLTKPVTRAELKQAIQATGRPIRRILLVDDDPDVSGLFSRMLQTYDEDLEVATASGGQQALEELRRSPPDLVLLDIVMPEMDGWEVLASMREDETLAEVPIFLVSAQDPIDQPLVSESLLVTMSQGLSLNHLLRCSLEIPRILLEPEREPDLGPV